MSMANFFITQENYFDRIVVPTSFFKRLHHGDQSGDQRGVLKQHGRHEDEKRFDLVVRVASEQRASLEDVQHLLLPVPAPMDGVVITIVTEEGQTVNAAQSAPTILKLADLDTMTVKAQISEADLDQVQAGQSRFTILGDRTNPSEGVLRAIEPAPESGEQ